MPSALSATGLAACPAEMRAIPLDELFRTHARRVERWAQRLGGPRADVADIVQEVFLAAHRHAGRFRGEASVTTWLYRITANEVRMRRRRARLRAIHLRVGVHRLGDLIAHAVERMERRQRVLEHHPHLSPAHLAQRPPRHALDVLDLRCRFLWGIG